MPQRLAVDKAIGNLRSSFSYHGSESPSDSSSRPPVSSGLGCSLC
jgi:hypothetical protein